MWLSGVLLLICHYQMVSASKTIMTNEISMPSLGHKEEVPTFHRLQPKDGLPTKYRSARFERLRGAPNNIKPVFVEPAVIETEELGFHNTPSVPIEVVPSSETVTEVPLDFAQALETPSPLSFTEFSIESQPIFKDTDEPSTPEVPSTTEVPSTPEASSTSEEPSTPVITSTPEEPTTPEVLSTPDVIPTVVILTTSEQPSTSEQVSTPEQVLPSELPAPAPSSTEQTSEVSRATPAIHQYAEERVYPTMVSVQPSVEFIEVLPSHQIEVSSTNTVEEAITTTTKAPKKRRHRRKHRKLRKLTRATESPTEITTATEIITEPSTPSTETETSSTTTPTTTPTTTATTTTPTTTHINTFPTSGSVGPKIGESYLGGWNEDEAVIVTTSGPSLGSAINQFSEIPSSISIDDDKAIKEYYEKYYAEWYQKHNQAIDTPGESALSVPREIKIELAKPSTPSLETASPQSSGISSSTAEPTKEQLDKVCDYVAKISKSFGIKDLVGFAKNNCSFVKSFHPTATCEQIQHLMSYCVTGVLVNNQ